MRKIKKILFVFVALLLLLPSFLVTAAANSNKSEDDVSSREGTVSSKDEVVYAKLSATGERQEIYVVNILDVEQAGKVVDFGRYSHLKNLTDLAELEQQNGAVEFVAPKGKFYYQGNIDEQSLPWNVSVSYLLDGKMISPDELAGKDGHVQIRVQTNANEEVDPIFFQNYLLQVSLSLDLEIYRNIVAQDGMIANAGKNKQITFTVMPEKEGDFLVEADVQGFELEGIDISAVPSSMAIDSPDIDEMVGDMESLTDAIEELHNGVGELDTGVSQINSGVKELRTGSEQYQDGMKAVAASSSSLIDASKQINEALVMLNRSLSSNSEEMDLGELKKLQDGLHQIAGRLKKTSTGLATLKKNYAISYQTLDGAMNAIPAQEISEAQIQELYGSGADPDVLDRLLDTYSAALKAKGTYTAVKAAFDGVNSTLEQVSGGLLEITTHLETMAKGISSSLENNDMADSFVLLQKGISDLSANYKKFHSGLVGYAGGVSQLSSSYGMLNSGIADLSTGTGELESGVSGLHDGTGDLKDATSNIPEQMKEEVEQMMAEYDKSDFEAVSFMSGENENINSVQFVLKTESIKYEEPEKVEELEEEPQGFWARLLKLFK
ncbi:YhgE/Pip domain-containing protein [Robertmurraya sp. FSL W8-0741]|uniref:YhgE/Pip domain-containing protein n=1 Tax=Robertmurraya sp. FSL W8-0741 TaxID=2954629 RepID=UPI0030F6A326